MLVHAKNTIGKRVVEMAGLAKIAVIKNIIVDPDNGNVLALSLGKKNTFGKEQVVSLKDITEFYSDGVLVRDHDSIVDADEIIKVKNVLDKKTNLFGSKVSTQNGDYLGFLEDFIFDTDMMFLATITTRKKFSSEKRIINADRIMTILPGRIIIRDIIEKARIKEKWEKAEKIAKLSPVVE